MLLSADADTCRDGLAWLRKLADEDNGHAVRIVLATVSEMSRDAELTGRLQAERFRSMLRCVKLDDGALEVFVAHAPELAPGLLNALSAALPANLRRRLTAVDRVGYGANEPERKVLHSAADPEMAVRAELNHRSTAAVRVESSLSDEDQWESSVVLLLSKQDNQDANKTLLGGRNLRPIRYDSIGKLMEELGGFRDICACVVDGSFLCGATAEEQKNLFEAIGAYSTFIWIRVEDAHLKLSHEQLRALIRSVRQGRVPLSAEALSIQGSGRLRETELDEITQARDWLRSHRRTKFDFDNLREDDVKVLAAAIRQYTYQQGGPRDGTVELVKLRFFDAGRSSARTVLVRAGTRQVVAKIDSRSEVLEEMGRFRKFVMGWDDRLYPMAYFHGDVRVVVFSFVDSMRQPSLPAPMLADELEGVWNEEIFTSNDRFERDSRVGDLKQALDDVTRRLCDLNKRTPPLSNYESYSDLGMQKLRQLESRGVTWGLGERTRQSREIAEQQYVRLSQAAVVHGDLHLQNILVRGGREAFLIDYRASGIGHPAIDLVRLELALYLDFFRPVDTDPACHELQRAIADGQDFESLSRRFRDLLRPAINELCIYGSVLARDRAIEAVVAHGGSERDYWATKCLVAWQRLLLWRTQTSLTRQVIATLSETGVMSRVLAAQ